MDSPEVIAHYEALSTLTEQMHAAAIHGEWDRLVELEEQRGRVVATIRQLDAVSTLDGIDLQRKAQLIKNILTQEADIRTRTETWMTELQKHIKSSSQEKQLLRAYDL